MFENNKMVLYIQDRLSGPETQRRLVLVIVCIALLLDNMLYMVIVPIIPVFLQDLNVERSVKQAPPTGHALAPPPAAAAAANWTANVTRKAHLFPLVEFDPDLNQDASVGFLFASKAIVQLMVNPLSGTLIDSFGYDMPMLFGLSIIFVSTAIFAFGQSYGVLFFARSLQGAGSAFADTSGLAMIAHRHPEEEERSRALGIALAFISFGCLFAPPFGGILYEFAGKCVPFLLLALAALVDGLLIVFVMQPARRRSENSGESGATTSGGDEVSSVAAGASRKPGTPIYKLILDPYIAVCAGALVMANVSLAFLEPTIAMWMQKTMQSSEWEIGMVWLPAFFPHVGGVYLTVKLMKRYPQQQWAISTVGLCLEGLSCLFIPLCTSYVGVIFPIMVNCFGIAMVDTAILPTLGYLVDVRHVSVYGSVYAIADISYSLAYAFGPMIAGGIVNRIGYTWLNVAICVSNLLYAPLLLALRDVHRYKQFQDEDDDGDDGERGVASGERGVASGERGVVGVDTALRSSRQKGYDTYTMAEVKVHGRMSDSDDDFTPYR